MQYREFNIQKYAFFHDFGGGGEVFSIKGPKGKKGTLLNYGVYGIIESFTAASTAAMVAVGNGTDPDAYGEELSLGTSAADTVGEVSIDTLYRYDQVGGGAGVTDRDDYILNGGEIPADTVVYLTCTAPTGGGEAGQGTAFVEILWAN